MFSYICNKVTQQCRQRLLVKECLDIQGTVEQWCNEKIKMWVLCMNVYECLVVVGGAIWREMAATLLSVCPRAAVATNVAYHHRLECVWMKMVCSACRLKVKNLHLHKSPSIPPIYPNKIKNKNHPKMDHELKGVWMCHSGPTDIDTSKLPIMTNTCEVCWESFCSVKNQESLWLLLELQHWGATAGGTTDHLSKARVFTAVVFTGLIDFFCLSINLLILWFPNCGPRVLQMGHQIIFKIP